MENTEFLSAGDPDLQIFEALIGSKLYRFSKFRTADKPSYAHKDFCEQSLNFDMLPGNDSPYCPIALGIFSEVDYHNYELECFEFLQRSSKKFGIESFYEVALEFENLVNNPELISLYKPARDVWLKIFKLCSRYSQHFLDTGKEAIYSDLLDSIVDQSEYIAKDMMKIANSQELNHGKVKSLNIGAKYALLVLVSIQSVRQFLDPYFNQILRPALDSIYKGSNTSVSELGMSLLVAPRAIILHVLTAQTKILHKNLGPRSRKGAIKSPADFMYVELSGGHKASEVKRYFRWLFIKAWAFSYLQKKGVSLSSLADMIAQDDRFYYLDKMQLAESIKDEDFKNEFKLNRAKPILNEFVKWKGYQGADGYITSKILEKESRRKSYPEQ